jgi:archaeal type IV pilus assembly protein PilA
MNRFLKSKKALSPVVAAIILIAVTVAVSIAVAAWMGSLSVGFMDATDEVTITGVDFTTGDAESGRIVVYVTNSGTSRFTVQYMRVNAENTDEWSSGTSDTIAPGDSEIFTITHEVVAGQKYSVALFDADGTLVGAHIATA